ncbi:MAG: CYTH domain-containing protein [Oscillospiraceae bacterium]|nr:CYTH domain-containing protein [Oscillospiraceae bacterium]
MGREFELKFAATALDHEVLRSRFQNLSPIAMETTYYDTPDGDIRRLRWTLRRRMENGISVCALKTPGEGFGHGEWEVCCEKIEKAIGLLLGKGAPKQLYAFAQAGLHPVCGARFTRLAGLIEAPGCTVELALDEGVLLGGGREQPLCEIEVELKAGSEDAAAAFAMALAQEFGLRPETRSKIVRAMALAEQ